VSEVAAHHVVIVGGGFGGLAVAQGLKGTGVRITIVDQRNHHLFQPLLYQVGTATLATSEIAWPIRQLFRRRKDITTLLGAAAGVDTAAREVLLEDGGKIRYDSLVLATGARHAYFGHDEWEPFAPALKTLEDATSIRRRILLSFERAERESDAALRPAWLTFVIVGGGATGVELAGAIADLAYVTLPDEFRHIDTRKARVLLIEAGPRILPTFTPDLSAYAHAALERLGVEIQLGIPVSECSAQGVVFGEQRLAAKVILWAAGVRASPAALWLGAATIDAWHGKPVPGIAPAAKQQGTHVADTIKRRLAGDSSPRPFRYRHAGNLATIGKRAAVIDFGWLKVRGYLAWWIWGLAHIYFLIGVRNRLAVALSWLWIYLTGTRGACLITQGTQRSDPR
jgi:NADH dehydrogenase